MEKFEIEHVWKVSRNSYSSNAIFENQKKTLIKEKRKSVHHL